MLKCSFLIPLILDSEDGVDSVTCSTEGHRYYATLFSLLGNRGRRVPWIRSPLGIVAFHGNQQ
jgi:hypothetical protein